MAKTHELTVERLRELLEYAPETGVFTRRVTRGGRRAGSVAGSIMKSGSGNTSYILIRIDGFNYLAHRLAFMHIHGKFPDSDIDHIDLNGLNNRFYNLRESTESQNHANITVHKNNKLGVKGVHQRSSGNFMAQIMFNRKKIYLGTYPTAALASAAYSAKARELFGEFSRAN
jgi:hypothetical protein